MNPAEYVLKSYQPILSLPVEEVGLIGKVIPIPQFPIEVIGNLFRKTIELLQKEPVLVEFSAPTYLIGDIHGNLFDLCRVLIYTRLPPSCSIVFLGDYVDRGEFSVDVIILLFTLYCMFPKNIVLLRGNHEFACVNEVYGFMQEVETQYKCKDLYFLANNVFNFLPMACLISQKVFAVHGGLSPDLKNISDLQNYKKPIQQYYDNVLSDIVWSDPSTEQPDYYRSNRGTGVTFGEVAVKNFFNNTGITNLVRGHQCVPLGISKFANSRVYTVFSCSNYTDSCGNRCGILLVDDIMKFHSFSLPPLEIPKRSQIKFLSGISAIGETESLAVNLKMENLHKHKVKDRNLSHVPFVAPSSSLDSLKKHTLLRKSAESVKGGLSLTVLPPLKV